MIKRIAYFIIPIPLGYILFLIFLFCFSGADERDDYLDLPNIIGSSLMACLILWPQVLLYGALMNFAIGKIRKYMMVCLSALLGILCGASIELIVPRSGLSLLLSVIGAVVGFAVPVLIEVVDSILRCKRALALDNTTGSNAQNNNQVNR